MASWSISWSREAGNYLDDNGVLVENLYRAIKALARNQGVPVDGWHTEMSPNEIWLDIENHIIVYRRIQDKQSIRVNVLKPKPEV